MIYSSVTGFCLGKGSGGKGVGATNPSPGYCLELLVASYPLGLWDPWYPEMQFSLSSKSKYHNRLINLEN